jgi:hypothetical protein
MSAAAEAMPAACGECWEWNGPRTKGGYGATWVNGKKRMTHRLAYEWAKGPIPPGMYVMHRCDNPPCCNPDHLAIGTPSENQQDRLAKGRNGTASKTHCKNGHEFNEQNTYRRKGGSGRGCRACQRAADIRQRRRKGARPDGLSQPGEANAAAKLTAADVLLIRASKETEKVLARRFGVSANTIGAARRRETWAHLEPDLEAPSSRAVRSVGLGHPDQPAEVVDAPRDMTDEQVDEALSESRKGDEL